MVMWPVYVCSLLGNSRLVELKSQYGLQGVSFQFTTHQCVTKPKIWAKPNPKLFSETNFFRYRIRYFFRYQFFSETDTDTFIDTKIFRNRYRYFFRYQKFSKPIPILFPIPKNFETDTDTFSDTKKNRNRYRYFFWYQFFFETDTDTFFDTKNFRNRYRYHQKKWKSFETEKFRNRNVTLCWGLGWHISIQEEKTTGRYHREMVLIKIGMTCPWYTTRYPWNQLRLSPNFLKFNPRRGEGCPE